MEDLSSGFLVDVCEMVSRLGEGEGRGRTAYFHCPAQEALPHDAFSKKLSCICFFSILDYISLKSLYKTSDELF